MVVIGVIGKSLGDDSNKMAGFDMEKFVPVSNAQPVEGEIKFYFEQPPTKSKTLYIHFQTTFDVAIMEQMLLDRINDGDDKENQDELEPKPKSKPEPSFSSFIRTKFAQVLLFAVQMCHIIVLVEPSNVFDTSYLSIFKALKIIR